MAALGQRADLRKRGKGGNLYVFGDNCSIHRTNAEKSLDLQA